MALNLRKSPNTDYVQTIYTRYSGPKVRGSKIVAKVPGRRTSVSTPCEDALSMLENHEAAAWRALGRKFETSNYELLGYGDAPNENGYAFVFKRVEEI